MRGVLTLGLLLASLATVGVAREKPQMRPASAALEGLWSGASFTELERPDDLKVLVLTPEQAHAWETKLKPSGGVNVGADELGQATSEFPESGTGLMRVRGEIRASIIFDPPDGKLPLTTAAKADLGIEPKRRRGYDNVEARPQDERCLASDTGGAPSIPTADANVIQILEAPGYVVILAERYHDARIVPLNAERHPTLPPSWLGDSTGRWEGNVLVVETANYRPGLTEGAGSLRRSPTSKMVERFTRISPGEIHYEFSVTDPYLYTQPVKGEYVFKPANALFEYACHEGNYSIINILAAARLGLQEPPKDAPAVVPKP